MFYIKISWELCIIYNYNIMYEFIIHALILKKNLDLFLNQIKI